MCIYYPFWQRQQKNATGGTGKYQQMNANKHSFLKIVRAWVWQLTSSRHFFRSSTASSRVIPERENIHRLIELEAISLNRNFIKFKQLFSWAPKPLLPSSQKTLSRCTEDALHQSTHTATSHWESICYTEWGAWRNSASHGQGPGFGEVQPSLSPRVYYSFKSAPSVLSWLQVSDSRRGVVLGLRSLLGISFNNGKGTCVMPLLFSHIRIKSSTL